jgi:hypothetical protein
MSHTGVCETGSLLQAFKKVSFDIGNNRPIPIFAATRHSRKTFYYIEKNPLLQGFIWCGLSCDIQSTIGGFTARLP